MAHDNWHLALLELRSDPTQVILTSEHACAVNNSYPKAQTHFLVLPKIDINNIFELRHNHLPLLEDMLTLAKRVIAMRNLKGSDFLFGFKLNALMHGLTMHIISKDFNSNNLKSRRHWINFHTPIFMPYKIVFGLLKVNGAIDPLPTEKLDAMSHSIMQCCQCDFKTFSCVELRCHYQEHWINQHPPPQETIESTPRLIESHSVLAVAQTKLPAESNVVSPPSTSPFDFNDFLKTLPAVQQSATVEPKVPQNPIVNENVSTAEEVDPKIMPYFWQYEEKEDQRQLHNALKESANRLTMPQSIKLQPDHPYFLQMPPLLESPLLLPWYRQQPYQNHLQPLVQHPPPNICKTSVDMLGSNRTDGEMARKDWSLALVENKLDPTQHILSSELSCAINDRYPKAQTHFLVLPKIDIENIFELQRAHLPLLEDMLKLANRVLALRNLKQYDFLYGFKLDALMKGLTMHIISKDFVSNHLKKPRHWIIFHTPIFMPYIVAYNTLKQHGAIERLPEKKLQEFRDSVLQCNQCTFKTKNFNKFKEHLLMHWQKKSTLQLTEKHTKSPQKSDISSQSKPLYDFTNWIETLPMVKQSEPGKPKEPEKQTSTSSDDNGIDQKRM